jgi:hypothetical protein
MVSVTPRPYFTPGEKSVSFRSVNVLNPVAFIFQDYFYMKLQLDVPVMCLRFFTVDLSVFCSSDEFHFSICNSGSICRVYCSVFTPLEKFL